MEYLKALVLALFSVGAAGCYGSSPGVVHASGANPLVVVGAGEIEVGAGARYYARYIIDRRAEVCWFFAGDSVAPMECCKLASVPEAKAYLSKLAQTGCQTPSPP